MTSISRTLILFVISPTRSLRKSPRSLKNMIHTEVGMEVNMAQDIHCTMEMEWTKDMPVVAQQFTHTDQCQMTLIIMPSYTQDLVPDIPEQMDGVEIKWWLNQTQRFKRKNKTPSWKFQLVSKINTPDYCHSLEIYGTHLNRSWTSICLIIFNKKNIHHHFLILMINILNKF